MAYKNVRRISLRATMGLREILLIPSSFRCNGIIHASLPDVGITYSTRVIPFPHQTSTALLSSAYPARPIKHPAPGGLVVLFQQKGGSPQMSTSTMEQCPAYHTPYLFHIIDVSCLRRSHVIRRINNLAFYTIYSALLLSSVAILWACIKNEPIVL
jgi:hypothetical protein